MPRKKKPVVCKYCEREFIPVGRKKVCPDCHFNKRAYQFMNRTRLTADQKRIEKMCAEKKKVRVPNVSSSDFINVKDFAQIAFLNGMSYGRLQQLLMCGTAVIRKGKVIYL